MRSLVMILIGTLLIGVSPRPVQGDDADTARAVIGAIGSIAAARNDRDYYHDGYYPYRSYSRYGLTTPYGYRVRRSGILPFGAAYYVDQGDYRNYRDANGNYLGRERIRW